MAVRVMAAVYAWFFPLAGGLASETLFTFLALTAFILVLVVARRGTVVQALSAGAAFGLAALTRSNVIALAPFVRAWWWRRSGIRRPLLFAFAAGVIGVLLPFTIYVLVNGEGHVLGSSGGGETLLSREQSR